MTYAAVPSGVMASGPGVKGNGIVRIIEFGLISTRPCVKGPTVVVNQAVPSTGETAIPLVAVVPEGVTCARGIPLTIAVAPELDRTNIVVASGVMATEFGPPTGAGTGTREPTAPGDPIGATLLTAIGTATPPEGVLGAGDTVNAVHEVPSAAEGWGRSATASVTVRTAATATAARKVRSRRHGARELGITASFFRRGTALQPSWAPTTKPHRTPGPSDPDVRSQTAVRFLEPGHRSSGGDQPVAE